MDNKTLSKEEIAALRKKKQLAIIKSSNELLEYTKESVMKSEKLDELEKSERLEEIKQAQEENIMKAQTYLQATRSDVENAEYGTVTEEHVKKYEERLKKKGLTDEQLHEKAMAEVTVATGSKDSKKPIPKRRRKSKKSEAQLEDEVIVRVDNEEELMKATRVTSNEDLQRRRKQSTDTMSTEPFNEKKTPTKVMAEVVDKTKVKIDEQPMRAIQIDAEKDKPKEKTNARVLSKQNSEPVKYDFENYDIPSYVQYDIIPLPSNGECYSHKKGRIPVAYLTAADENIIASPNMYRDGKIIDVILERKILDKDINVEELTTGDRDAIALWLRATGYGVDFPIISRHPDTGKQYEISVKLDSFEYFPFNLKGDENGWFEFILSNGDVMKFKYLTNQDEIDLRDTLIKQTSNYEKYSIMKYSNFISEAIVNLDAEEEVRKELQNCIEDLKDNINEVPLEFNEELAFSNSITDMMIIYTQSINGNTDREYIENYLQNMRTIDAYNYRKFIMDNKPGVDFKITVNVPESDGGGSYDTFLRVDDTIFVNI